MARSWSQRFADRLDSFGTAVPAGPPAEGVSGLDVEPGAVTARVRGERQARYDVRIGLPEFSPAQWTRAQRAMAADPDCRARLLDNELAPDTEDLFARAGLRLFPARTGDLVMECSCPDWALPCAHLAAVLRSLADAFDADPYLVLVWRGRTRDELLDQLPPAVPRREPPDSALLRLGRPGITVRGRDLTEVLGPAYEAFTDW
ncbi:hypothetical protein QMK19_12175 [Streptomyces sp. H10-C2]|uniref:SWIM zinc finger family protein n=1 Tax=unclassified Streptomyces TaxID=2593676 RepID=UPI0024BBD885|nr:MULTISPECIES: SWIM zinc finger family protein [unclassified Streptomyces]MDJ0341830.1 hypothetical protein [Streptomyces sp. PH10-H1]MDJ0370416.1 hypothetical protein [Streptomyces sp. H10-C2]